MRTHPESSIPAFVSIWLRKRRAAGLPSTLSHGPYVLAPREAASPDGFLPVLTWCAEGTYRDVFGLTSGFGFVYPESQRALFGRGLSLPSKAGSPLSAPVSQVMLFVLDVLEEAARVPTARGTIDVTPLANRFAFAFEAQQLNARPAMPYPLVR